MSVFKTIQVGEPVSRAGPWGPAQYAKDLECGCGNTSFTIRYPGDYSVTGTCTACGATDEIYSG